jgi:hypothetical protein
LLSLNFRHDVSQVVSESVATLGELATRDRRSRVNVLLANLAVVLKVPVHVIDRQLERLLRVLGNGAVQLGLVEARSRVKVADVEGLLSQEIPVSLVKGLLEIAAVVADDGVPKHVRVVDLGVAGQGLDLKEVASLVTLGEIVSVARNRMERLMDVSKVVNEQTEVPRHGKVGVHGEDILLGTMNDANGVDNCEVHLRDGPFYVERLEEVIIWLLETLIEERSVDEMPV